jgi:hypothetical protein
MIHRKTLLLFSGLILLSGMATAQPGRWEKELSGKGWSLWLDKAALWYDDDIYLPPVDVSTLPVNPPTCGWDELHTTGDAKTVNVPGTVEEHYWGQIGGAVQDTNGNYIGVSWWSRKFHLDETLRGKRIILAFQSVNLRAEIFVNGRLVGYDVIGNTPFEVNATPAVMFGRDNQLDVRITDAVGNFTWDDNILMRWGKNLVPAVHGFGGITGNVILRATDHVSISDIHVQNQPDPKKVNIIVSLDNFTGTSQSGSLNVTIHEKGNPDAVIWSKTVNTALTGSSKVITLTAYIPKAKLWELTTNEEIRATNLYEAAVRFTSSDNRIIDNSSQRFGFRWFDVGEKGGDKRFYLNGKRVFIIAAMTRGFWPKNGISPTPEMTRREMEVLYDLGFNTMNLHRAIGPPRVFEYADSAGIFTYQEPGGYRVTANLKDNIEGPDEQAFKWRREKLRRMVIRDRSFPSLIIVNLKNAETIPPSEDDKKNMLMVHELDPTRIVTYNSGNDKKDPLVNYYIDRPDDPFELHMLPLNPSLIYGGWWDHHHNYAYSGYTDDMYRNPGFYHRGVVNAMSMTLPKDSLYPLNKNKVLFFGEDGAFGTMIRLQKIKEELDHKGAEGFRELEHIDWFNAYDRFLDETGFREAYANVDSLTMSLGRNMHYFHARTIENLRMGNIAEAYTINGWASAATRTDLVDMYRNPTADPSIIRHYTRPLYIAVKIRNKVVPSGTTPIADFFIVNEKNLKGRHILKVVLNDEKASIIFYKEFPVNIKGGEEFGQMLVENIKLPVITRGGYYKLKATIDEKGIKQAEGFDEIYAVDLTTNLADINDCSVLENDNIITDFMNKNSGSKINAFIPGRNHETNTIIVGNHETISPDVVEEILKSVQNGSKLIVLSNADKFAQYLNDLLRSRPTVYNGGGIINMAGSGRLFVGFNPLLKGLPQAQGMSWEYQCFYKGAGMGEPAKVSGLRLNTWGTELIVALGSQGSKEILSALSRVSVGKGSVILSTLNLLPHLQTNEPNAVVAKKLFLNLLEY